MSDSLDPAALLTRFIEDDVGRVGRKRAAAKLIETWLARQAA